jgi:hypothetical protein
MPLSDQEIIAKYNIERSDTILDVGGSMKQHSLLKIDTLVDIIRPEESPYGRGRLKAKHFIRLDITQDGLPFKDNEFDFCICTHTLEDLTNPYLAIKEMSRVAKRGLIVTPSMGFDMVFSHIDFTNWATGARRVPGLGHHKWLFYKEGERMIIMPKNYPLLYSSEFQFTRWFGEKELEYYWEDKINYREIKDLNFHQLIGEYKRFVRRNRKKIKPGLVLLYFDNPFIYLKEWIKLLLRRGRGFRSKINK